MKKIYISPTLTIEVIDFTISVIECSNKGCTEAEVKVIVDDPSYREAGLKEDIWE